MPFETGVTLTGWGVVRGEPWDFVGIYDTESEALAKASEMGDGYEVKYGDNQQGTDNFIWMNEGKGPS